MSEPPSRKISSYLGGLGLGLVAGASDNDPTSVATISVVGSTTVFALSWLVVLILPMLLVIQVVSSRVGVVTQRSLQQIFRDRFGSFWSFVSMALVVVVDLITIAADLEGGGAALNLLFGGGWHIYVPLLALLAAGILIIGRYRDTQRYLRFVLLVFLAYVGAGLLAHPDWGQVLQNTLVPTFELSPIYASGILALLGTTLTSYVYFWETIEEEEERPQRRYLGKIEIDAAIGIVLTVTIFWFILISSAATAGTAGIRVETAEDAALALEPLAGGLAKELFAIGLLASSLLAVPVLAATTGYVVVQSFGGKGSIDEPIERDTATFYSTIVLSLAIGAALSMLGIEPIQLLYLASIAGGLGTPILMFLLLRVAGDREVMGGYRIGGFLKVAGWFTGLLVSLASVVYVATRWLGVSS